MGNSSVHGTCDPRFQRIKDAFALNLAENLETGAAVAMCLDGKPVVNLWGGFADAARTKPWQHNTLVNVWSVTKGVVALAVAIMVERGKLDYNKPVAEVWPAFAQNGKAKITLGQVMSHQAGLNGLSVPMDFAGLAAYTPYVTALETMAPLWEPGSRCVYHALTYGHLAAETLRHADGRRMSQFVQDEIAAKLGVPFYIGVPPLEDSCAAEIIAGEGTNDWVRDVTASAYPHACQNPTPEATAPNDRAWRAAEIPGGNGHTTALALATIYGNMVGRSSPLLSPKAVAMATEIRFDGLDACNGLPAKWGAGFSLNKEGYSTRAGHGTFGHGGWGGALGFADPKARLGFAYVTNHMRGFSDRIDIRRQRLIDAAYDAI